MAAGVCRGPNDERVAGVDDVRALLLLRSGCVDADLVLSAADGASTASDIAGWLRDCSPRC